MKTFCGCFWLVLVIVNAVKEVPEKTPLTPVSAASSTLDVRVREDDEKSQDPDDTQPMDESNPESNHAAASLAECVPATASATASRVAVQPGLVRLADGTVDFEPEYRRSHDYYQRMQQDMDTLTERYTRLSTAYTEVQERADERHRTVQGYKQECDRLHNDLNELRSELGRSQHTVGRQAAALAVASREYDNLRRNPRQVDQRTASTQTKTSIFSTRRELNLDELSAFYRRAEFTPDSNPYGYLAANPPEVRRHRFGDPGDNPAEHSDLLPSSSAPVVTPAAPVSAHPVPSRRRDRRRPSPSAFYRNTAGRLSYQPARNYDSDRRHRRMRSRSPNKH